MKIDSCLIIKNEEENIEQLINKLLMFSNEVHITDTGSTDDTINIIERLMQDNNNLFLHHFEWCFDFSKARNYSLICYECNADYQFWCDGDDELNNKLIETLIDFTKSYHTEDIYFIPYKYHEDQNYNQNRTSLLKVSAKFEWYDPIHEFLRCNDRTCNYDFFYNGSLIIHHKNANIDHNKRNLEIFFNMERNGYQFTCRNRYYYGGELHDAQLRELAIVQYHKCIDSIDEQINYVDQINSCMGLIYLKDPECLIYFQKLFNKGIYRKDLFYLLGDYFYELGNIDLARLYYVLCINCEEPPFHYMFEYDGSCYVNALLQLGLIEYNKGNIDNAIFYNNHILNIDPDNAIAKNNIEYIKTNNIDNKNE